MDRDLNAAINVLDIGLLNGGSAPLQPQITSDVSSRYICDSVNESIELLVVKNVDLEYSN